MSDSCKGCSAEIEWVITTGGKKMPIDPEPIKVALKNEDGTVTVKTGYQSHFASCDKASTFRKPRPRQGTEDSCGRQCANCETWVNPRQQGAIYIGARSFCNADCRRQAKEAHTQ